MKILFLIFFSVCACISKAQTIKQAEYFIDVDKGIGKNKKITLPSSADSNYNFNIDLSDVSVGTHKLYIRTKDNNGKWGLSSGKNIDVVKSAVPQKIIAAEYFFNADKGFGNATQKIFSTPLPDGKFKFKIPFNKIPANADAVFVRVQDSAGDWSITKIALFNVQSALNNDVTSGIKINSDNDKNRLSVFPNPATQTINISYTLNSKSALIKIWDANGKAVMQSTIADGSNTKMNIGKLAAGEYILEINDGKTIQSAKFIRQLK